ncbi:type II toxin-antitoxin system PemK/MazF family toxin [Bacillus mobilis]|uniref:PemK-like protein n=1 Tax=Bacillus mobilis TaxID=2026190 RepID=A0A1Y5YTB0_9BACI|nr:type II toxin-antitoxin system PemK/MazF family toxin [Bacillus mobilis]MCU5595113.1 type II toxin-antitoxin system PemK/MazF family toxin [Bacillus mobilis]MCU5737708.1 type II toxin-antitoxin system PemK/MazF family toxin [Bacillus mobilis]SMD66113.1 PemK-like protein [Bacillus mobilis]
MLKGKVGEVWYADYPYEEDKSSTKARPAVIVFEVDDDEVVAIKLTTHEARACDQFDVELVEWKHAGLKHKSTARVSKFEYLKRSQLLNKKGDLHPDDEDRIAKSLMRFMQS